MHVHSAAEVRAFGNRHARRNDVAVNRAVVADVDFIAGRHVPGDFAEHDHRLGKHLSLDPTVGTDREYMVAKLDRALDVALDRQIFPAVQLAFDDDGLANVHDVLLHVMARLRTKSWSPRHRWRGWLRCSRWLPACRADAFITFPH